MIILKNDTYFDKGWGKNPASKVDRLTAQQEANQSVPWKVDDAPPEFSSSMLRGIIGVEIAISEIQGKWKVSQNRPEVDIRGVHDGLLSIGELPMAREVVQHIRNG